MRDINCGMDILDIAIQAAGGVGKLADKLGLTQQAVSNWRLRESIPRAWEMVLRQKYARAIKAAQQ